MTTFAPVISPIAATKKLICVSLKWTDNTGADLDAVRNSGNDTATNFKRLSNNQFNFTSSAYSISVPFAHAQANVAPAVANAKKQLTTKGIIQDGSLIYAMINNDAGTFSHSGGDTSNILNTLTTTFYHEIGRTNPMALGSSGAFVNGVYEDQADGTTFMSHFASNNLTASQLYYLGWLSQTQMGLCDPSTGTQEFTVYNLGGAIGTPNLMAVMMNDSVSAKPLFVSRPTFADGSISWALHIPSSGNNKGSERIEVFGKTATYQGLTFTEISSDTTTATIQISKATT
jgi:hypothetical protein